MPRLVVIDQDADGNEQEIATVEVPPTLETFEDFEAWMDREIFADEPVKI